MDENYIVLKGKRYDIILPEESKCEQRPICKECPLSAKGCMNIIDFIDDTLGVVCEDEVVIINHE